MELRRRVLDGNRNLRAVGILGVVVVSGMTPGFSALVGHKEPVAETEEVS